MKKVYYTLYLVSDNKEKPFSFTFKAGTARIIVAVILLFVIALIVGVCVLIPKAISYEQTLAENEQLIQDRLKVTEILTDYNKIRQMDHYIRSILGPDLSLPSFDSLFIDSLFISPGMVDQASGKSIEISYLDNIPIFPPVEGYITQGFIDDYIFKEDNHYGVDVAAPEGELIRAAASGVVVFSNWTYHFGYTVILYHSNGYYTIYGHNMRNVVEEHQYVSRGEILGYVGDTGISDGPHLHFEIWREGKPIDPQSMIYSYKQSDVSIIRPSSSE